MKYLCKDFEIGSLTGRGKNDQKGKTYFSHLLKLSAL